MARSFSARSQEYFRIHWLKILLIVAPIPFVCTLCYFLIRLHCYHEWIGEIQRIHKKNIQLESMYQKENAFLAGLKNPDHFYIDAHVESLCFLEPEIKKIEALLYDNSNDMGLQKRLHFLKEGLNGLKFAEVQTRQHPYFQEVEEKQQHPIEVNEEDLKKLLSLIEGVTIWPYGPKAKRPQLIIKEFQLSKKENASQDNVFTMNMDLIKREISSETPFIKDN